MKISILIAKTVLIVAIVPLLLLQSCSEEVTEYAKFTFFENLSVAYNSEIEVGVETLKDGLSKIELFIGEEKVKEWNNPTGKIKYNLSTKGLAIGATSLSIKSYTKSGESYVDERLLRVVSDINPEFWKYDLIETYPHNISNFTQGLEFDGNQLFESTGQLGQSKIAKIELSTGKDLNAIGLDATHFGEGITILGETIYQLTWQTNKCFTYDKATLQIKNKDFTYQGEGWGICNDGTSLIMSNGTERLTFRDPETFAIIKTIEVYTNDQPVVRLNELEYVNGLIYANVWMTNNIVIIEPETGRVIAFINASDLATKGRGAIGEVFNGIAYNSSEDAIYVTGKNWAKLFKIKVQASKTEAIVKK